MLANNFHYQNSYGELKSTDLVEFCTPSELLSLFELIAPQFGATCNMVFNAIKQPLILFVLSEDYRVVVKSIDPKWSEDMQSEKFIMLAPVCKQGLLTYEDVNSLNRDNADIKFTIYTPKDGVEPYIGIDKLMSLAGGITVQSIIMMVNEFVFNQKTLNMALRTERLSEKPKAIH